jgi:hypothetical protein
LVLESERQKGQPDLLTGIAVGMEGKVIAFATDGTRTWALAVLVFLDLVDSSLDDRCWLSLSDE